ncbi:hypothetical protein DEJ05_05255 [Curtobacterium sp. MCLR17_045]|nr:hypothetical protein DEJ05_05255 [Curtobacterium sp. MCLR17_045]
MQVPEGRVEPALHGQHARVGGAGRAGGTGRPGGAGRAGRGGGVGRGRECGRDERDGGGDADERSSARDVHGGAPSVASSVRWPSIALCDADGRGMVRATSSLNLGRSCNSADDRLMKRSVRPFRGVRLSARTPPTGPAAHAPGTARATTPTSP